MRSSIGGAHSRPTVTRMLSGGSGTPRKPRRSSLRWPERIDATKTTSSGFTISTGFIPPERYFAPRKPWPATSTPAMTAIDAPRKTPHQGSSRSIRRRRSSSQTASIETIPIGSASCEGDCSSTVRNVPTRNCSAMPIPSSAIAAEGTAGEPE